MKFGIALCDERRKTLIASSFVDGMRLMSKKLGATGFVLWGDAADSI